MVEGNREYGPETCVFIPQYINKFLTDSGATRGIYPQGVYFHKASGKFLAQCHDKKIGQQIYLGVFENPDKAHAEWKKYKHKLSLEYADELSGLGYDLKVIQALKDRFNYQE